MFGAMYVLGAFGQIPEYFFFKYTNKIQKEFL